ncbi:hypothetical protein [Rhodovulum sp. 12E13]|uniref:hypothetical protein n=1 Tax=Rhodovulum sp. 12E13 TaxID=2203891 RepID=UPI001314745C|nr:hypothetical protein [Rhodovulum sp. 12E13]
MRETGRPAMVGVIGRSGAGGPPLLRMPKRPIAPTEGRVEVEIVETGGLAGGGWMSSPSS